MRVVKVAATQMACSRNIDENIANAERLVRKAAEQGANIILLQELFETQYFCQVQSFEFFDLAKSLEDNKAVQHFKKIAKELEVVLPISFYERCGNTAFNSIAIIDADGEILGVYRKTHIPDGIPYAEKFYFTPGDTGFKVWKTKYGTIGVGICWDQWFPETARAMALMGAEMLLYPTAIGNEPILLKDSMPHWQNTMCGHGAANIMPVIASNRIGTEVEGETDMTFYGASFICDETGTKIQEANRTDETILTAEFDLDTIAHTRREWGVFRDRRPEMYSILTTHGQF